jgi:hypothetical protein
MVFTTDEKADATGLPGKMTNLIQSSLNLQNPSILTFDCCFVAFDAEITMLHT